MAEAGKQFAKLLTQAIRRIKKKERITIGYLQDELGFLLGKDGGAMIEHWRKGYIPADLRDAINLGRALVDRGGLVTREELDQFLRSAGDQSPESECDTLFPHPPLRRPTRADYFQGREAELQDLLTQLMADDVVTLCGPGGIGKTALAAEAAWTLAPDDTPPERFPDGIFLHNFYSDPQVSVAFERICEAYGRKAEVIAQDAAERILREKRALLILDGAENADDLQAILDIRGQCGVIITSRDKTDDYGQVIMLDTLPLNESVALLKAWGKQRVPDPKVAEQICLLVGNLPLAIRLAGRYMDKGEQDATDYLAWLQAEGLEALDQGERQHQSLKLLLKKSLDRVGESAQKAMTVVGLLAQAPFDHTVIAQVLEVPTPQLVKPLGALVIYSLLERPKKRYVVSHALVHRYARQYLPPSPNMVDRLTHYYTTLVKQQAARGREGFAILDEERPHVMETVTRSAQENNWEAVRGLTRSIDNYLDLQGHWANRMTALETHQTAAQQLGDLDDAANTVQRIGTIYLQQGNWDTALKLLESARATYEQMGNRLKEARVLSNIGIVYRRKGLWEQAHAYFEPSLQMMRELGNRQGEAATLNNIAFTYVNEGRLQEAEPIYLQTIEIHGQEGDRRAQAQALAGLATLYLDQDRLQEALPLVQQSLDILKDLGDRFNEGQVLGIVGDIYQLQGSWDKAIETYQVVKDIFTQLGDTLGLGLVSLNFGRVYVALNNLNKAERAYQKAQGIFQALGSSHNEGIALMELASLLQKKNDKRQVVTLLQEALTKLNPNSEEYTQAVEQLATAVSQEG